MPAEPFTSLGLFVDKGFSFSLAIFHLQVDHQIAAAAAADVTKIIYSRGNSTTDLSPGSALFHCRNLEYFSVV